MSGLSVVYPAENDLTRLITNPDFEITEGMRLDGSVYRGDPFGWTRTGELNGQSWGVNADAANYHGKYVCWYNSTPMPSAFQLSQTINNLPPGEYILRCRLGIPAIGGITTQRLFAGNKVQYYGKESDYQNNLTPSEINTFAGYAVDPGNGSGINLKEMSLKFVVSDTTNLSIGIRSSNKYKNGSLATDNGGWFKVDYFRLELVTDYSVSTPLNRLKNLVNEAQTLFNSTSEGVYDGMYSSENRAIFNEAIQTANSVRDKIPLLLKNKLMPSPLLKRRWLISSKRNKINSYIVIRVLKLQPVCSRTEM